MHPFRSVRIRKSSRARKKATWCLCATCTTCASRVPASAGISTTSRRSLKVCVRSCWRARLAVQLLTHTKSTILGICRDRVYCRAPSRTPTNPRKPHAVDVQSLFRCSRQAQDAHTHSLRVHDPPGSTAVDSESKTHSPSGLLCARVCFRARTHIQPIDLHTFVCLHRRHWRRVIMLISGSKSTWNSAQAHFVPMHFEKWPPPPQTQ